MYDKKEPMPRVDFRLPKSDLDALRDIAEMLGCEVSALLRYATKKHILAARREFEKCPEHWVKRIAQLGK